MEQKDINNEEDKLLENLFQSFEPEKPSISFTKNTMNQVLHEWSSQPISSTTQISMSNKVMIGVAIACCAILIYLVDIKNAFSGMPVIENFKNSFSGIMSDSLIQPLSSYMTKIPSFVYIISLSSAFILLLDKLIHRITHSYQTK